MAYIRGDVASSGSHEMPYVGQMFPRVDVSPSGGWVAVDCNPDGSVFVETSADLRMELGARQPNNPACPRFQTDGHFHVYMVAWQGTRAAKQQLEAVMRAFDAVQAHLHAPNLQRILNLARIDVIRPLMTRSSSGVFGRHLVFSEAGAYLHEEATFNADLGIAMGILDVTPDGEILWWVDHHTRTLPGFPADLYLFNPRDRGPYTVGVFSHTWLGITVWDRALNRFYHAWPHDTQLLPGVADNGTVSAQGEGGGFIPRLAWIATPFDPLALPEPPEPGPEPPEPEPPEPGPEPPDPEPPKPEPGPEPPEPEPPMPLYARVEVNDEWVEVLEGAHQDAGLAGVGPVISVQRVDDGRYLQATDSGEMGWTTNHPGGWERCIANPGAYLVGVHRNGIAKRIGPWSA